MEIENSLASLTISAAAAAPTRLDMGAMVGAPVAAATNESPEEEELQAQRIASDSAFDSFLVDEHEQNGYQFFFPFRLHDSLL
jgi:hypothetical protein